MKRIAFALATVVVLGCGAISVAQTFPLTVKAYWTPSVVDATHSAPDSYTLTVDGGTPVIVGTIAINDVNCPLASNPNGCILTTAGWNINSNNSSYVGLVLNPASDVSFGAVLSVVDNYVESV